MKIEIKFLLCLGALVLFIACGEESPAPLRAYYERQVDARIKTLLENDSGSANTYHALRQEFDRVVLVSKDAGNAAAAVRLSARLLDRICDEYDFNRSDFPDISMEMDLAETEHQLRENELAFFNRLLLLKQEPSEEGLFTAH